MRDRKPHIHQNAGAVVLYGATRPEDQTPRPREARGIRIKWLRSLDSTFGIQVKAGGIKRMGNDFPAWTMSL